MKSITKIFMLLIAVLFFNCEVETEKVGGSDFILILNNSTETDSDSQNVGAVPRNNINSRATSGVVKYSESADSTLTLRRKFPDRKVRDTYVPSLQSRAAATGLTYNDQTASLYVDNEKMNLTKMYGDAESECLIFAETAKIENYKSTDWNQVGLDFDQKVHPTVTGVFGEHIDVDDNGKVLIIFYAMEEEDIAGYFAISDLSAGMDTNGMDDIFINLSMLDNYDPDQKPVREGLNGLIAHEFQHLINGSRKLEHGYDDQMVVWLDEAMAEYANYLVNNNLRLEHITLFSKDSDGSLRNGLGLVSWGGAFPDYTLSYIFGEYLRVQAGTDDIFKELIDHEKPGAEALVAVMNPRVNEFSSFSAILKAFRVANLVSRTDGIYGYKSESDVFTFSVYEPQGIKTVIPKLSAGGSFYFSADSAAQSAFKLSDSAGSNIEVFYGKDLP